MQTVEFKVAGKMYACQVPDRWADITPRQFAIFAGCIAGDTELIDPDTVRRILDIPDVVAVNLTVADWYFLEETIHWMLDLDSYTTTALPFVKLADGTECHGFADDFSDVTWEEWTIADSQANAGRWDIVAAVMYRPIKPNWDRHSDPRVEFNKWDSESRLAAMQALGTDTLAAVALNYKLLRHQLTRRFKRLFTPAGGDSKGGGTNLGSLIRNVMGDNFFEEEKYLKLPVPSVLFQLDRMVREEKERKRHERKTN